MIGWRKVKLRDLASDDRYSIVGGPFGSSLGRKDYVDHGVPVIRGSQLSQPGRFNFDDLVFVLPEKADRHLGNLAHPGDVIVTQRGTIGQVALIPQDSPYQRFLLSQSQMKISVNREIADPEFIYWLLAAPQTRDRLINHAMSAGVPHINLAILKELEVEIPELDDQKRIAALLRSFDELAAANARRIEILEETAQLLYREWFVWFRLPSAKQANLAQSDLGPVPEGWFTTTIGEVCDYVRGRSYRSDQLAEPPDGLPFLNLKCVRRGGGFRRDGIKRYSGPYKPEQCVVAGDVMVAMTDVNQQRLIVARSIRMPKLDEPFAIPSLDLAVLRPRQPLTREYLYGFLRFSRFGDIVKEYANGANVLHLAPERILDAPIVLPDAPTLERFSDIFGSSLTLCDELVLANERVESLRSLLLPRLMSGALNVSHLDLGGLMKLVA